MACPFVQLSEQMIVSICKGEFYPGDKVTLHTTEDIDGTAIKSTFVESTCLGDHDNCEFKSDYDAALA
ncbi:MULTISPECIES: hypothetical protein [Lysinibacillus]|jgi:hypothetical protein|uniref:Uncharacterized protein n=1 Tax=Lysinibacillus fusiformis TaxID=28031 RepID=A0A2I0V2X2_9BACI|nr:MULTISPECIES: hypothetical protein [Lysinibacillus]KUF32459.1 hypothetical protein AK833_12565 [Lysinibacillus sp. F5]MEE3808316.1 hypothetical protein [Lysinibacillus fusiformis]PKU52649.1 hypothetical protein CRI88_10065 [Lysinibacillus fusiformis]WCH47090.1 hypothetical protein NV349_18925 [Lysinibacillus sp. OF-1]SCY88423.1 hypothetical protein SAMN02787078_02879 [Lysinibacillus sp. SG9]